VTRFSDPEPLGPDHLLSGFFYVHHSFEPSRTDPMNLQLLVKDIGASIEEDS
jgi:hypothetical protein